MNLREAGEAITGAGGEFDAGLIYSPGPTGETDALVEQARKLPDLGAARIPLHDPSGSLEPHRASELTTAISEASGLRIGIYCQGSAGNASAAALEAAWPGQTASLAPSMPSRSSSTASPARGSRTFSRAGARVGCRQRAPLARLRPSTSHRHTRYVACSHAVRAAQHNLPAGLVAALDAHLRTQSMGDRLDEVLDELERIRGEAGLSLPCRAHRADPAPGADPCPRRAAMDLSSTSCAGSSRATSDASGRARRRCEPR